MKACSTSKSVIDAVCVCCVSQLYVLVEGSSKIIAKNLRHCFSVTAEWEFCNLHSQKKKNLPETVIKANFMCWYIETILASSTDTQVVKDLT